MDALLALWHLVQDQFARHLIAPLLALLHLLPWTDPPREIAGFLMINLLQVSIIGLVFRPIERRWPREAQSPRVTRIDRTYTLLKLLGLVPAFTYLVLTPLSKLFGGEGSDLALLQLDYWLPWFKQHPLPLFLAYFAIYDFTLYVVHRLQHAVPAWWMLHSLHHSQRQISCWSNDRDSFLDDVFEAVILAVVGLLIGVSPTEYAGLVLIGQLIENFSHANVRFGFGGLLDKLIVDPNFHRLHHMMDDPAFPNRHNCNFSLVFPIWDILFRTALYHEPPHPCGVSDPAIDADNGLGLWAQQRVALARFWRRLRPLPG